MEVGHHGSKVGYLGDLMYLPLDYTVSDYVLRRRGAISFGSSTVFASTPRFERRGGISYDKQDETAIYVRMLGDVRMKSKPDKSNEGKRKASISESDMKLLDKLSSRDNKRQWPSRFLSLHKRRQRRRPVATLSHQHISLLDTQYQRQAECLLSNVGNWNFDIFSLDLLTCGRPLLHIALNIFRQYDLINTFNLDIMKVFQVFSLIEDGYHSSNPYHNAVHAADVTQAMHCYLQEKMLQGSIPKFEIMTSLVAAMSHDLDHPGVNQTFMIATANHLAALYKNTSVLENHHWRSCIALLQQSGVFNHFDKKTWEQVEWQLRSLILATDITRQQEFLSRFKKYLDDPNFDFKNNFEQRHFMLQIALKCADICNPCRDWPVSKLWSERVCDEFFRQGDYERQLQIPVTPLCDRNATTVAKIQAGFLQFVVAPLFQEWQRFLPTPLSSHMITNVKLNLEQWQIIIADENKEKEILIAEQELNEQNDKSDVEDSAETVSLHVTDEEDDKVEDGRLPLTFAHLLDDQEDLSYNSSRRGSIRSLSPVREEPDSLLLEQRRHSMPPCCFQKEITNVTVHRDILPLTQYLRRRSLPTAMILHATSLERLTDKLSALASERVTLQKKSTSMEDFLARPKISNLSPSFEASRLASGLYVSSQPSSHGNAVRFLSKRRKSQTLPHSEDDDSDHGDSNDSDFETQDDHTFPKEALVNRTQFSVPIISREATHPSFNCVNNIEHDRVVNSLHEGLTNFHELNVKGNSPIDKMPHIESTDFDSGLIPPDITKKVVPNAVSPTSLSQ
ncbi:high affinity cAMP-specific 3',5'-cyclic phosphodiesterase 7 [Mytilus galloprovincialis]|uniref:Phosphodiesterase n=1 Tax=Mytilus galloprovincialis TaxID=29158 RepID=A0A8B6H8V4_MYTGA|nr:high affinity cAMP-specific 3',5'-cyclic phosphodiesterase 7 [Mytilus galloprovincialis]